MIKIKILILSLLCTLLTDSSFGQQKTTPLKIGLIADLQYADRTQKGVDIIAIHFQN